MHCINTQHIDNINPPTEIREHYAYNDDNMEITINYNNEDENKYIKRCQKS